jgi:hypothetical protein
MSYTLKRLIELFCDEPDSSFHNLRYQVRIKHQRLLARISREHGNYQLRNIRARNLLAWHKAWMSGGKIAMAHALISRLRVLFRFGATLLEDRECIRLLNTLRETRFPTSLPRNLRMTVEQVKAVRVQAHRKYRDTMAMAQALQFELMLRQKEVIGEWLPVSEPGASYVVNDKQGKWLMGLRWEEIDENLILRHNHSSEKGEDIKFDLKLAPMVLEEFALHVQTPIARLTRAALPASGPMIICETTGYPYSTAEFRRKWRIVAKLAGVPDNINNMDSSPAGMIFRGPDRAPPPSAINR